LQASTVGRVGCAVGSGGEASFAKLTIVIANGAFLACGAHLAAAVLDGVLFDAPAIAEV